MHIGTRCNSRDRARRGGHAIGIVSLYRLAPYQPNSLNRIGINYRYTISIPDIEGKNQINMLTLIKFIEDKMFEKK